MNFRIIVLIGMLCCSAWANEIQKNYSPVKVSKQVKIDLRYATTNNFMNQNLYGDFRTCYLHSVAAQKLDKAKKYLEKNYPGYQFLIFDCLRPRSIQKKLFEKVKGTTQEAYVANPANGSIHNYGFALDLSLIGPDGKELDMGTPYDSFEKLAEPQLEEQFVKQGKLTAQQIKNRKILREVMTSAGFTQLPNEWWHYDALDKKTVRQQYHIVE